MTHCDPNAFADAGFVIDRIAEPQPSQEALERYPAELAGIAGVPTFIRLPAQASELAGGPCRLPGVNRP